jgi:carbamoyl-phosphate synthase large subunit
VGARVSEIKRILLTGAGGAPALNFVKSLRLAAEPFYIIGVDCDKCHLVGAQTDERHLVPRASHEDYIPVLQELIAETGAQFLFAQPDCEIAVISEQRDRLDVLTYLPARETVRICQDKYETYRLWQEAGLEVPETRLISSAADLRLALIDFGEVWLRPLTGAAGRGALHTEDFEQARVWLDFNHGWGRYTVARYLSPKSVTWQSLWNRGELVVAQGRQRLYWEFADRTLAGVTGITGAAITVSDPIVDDIALRAVWAVDPEPHGVFSVDLTYDSDGVPNLTEINIGRFFTTHYFFSKAGLNMPFMLVKLAFGEEPPLVPTKINPLPSGLAWIRGMDMEPVLTTAEAVDAFERELAARRARRGAPVNLRT